IAPGPELAERLAAFEQMGGVVKYVLIASSEEGETGYGLHRRAALFTVQVLYQRNRDWCAKRLAALRTDAAARQQTIEAYLRVHPKWSRNQAERYLQHEEGHLTRLLNRKPRLSPDDMAGFKIGMADFLGPEFDPARALPKLPEMVEHSPAYYVY